MTKPENFGQTRVLKQNMPYQCQSQHTAGMPLSGGVLGKGQVVWVEPPPDGTRLPSRRGSRSISGYVEDIGVISLDPRFLAHATNG